MSAVQVFYNPVTYRWEVWRPGKKLPDCTQPSKDVALSLALHCMKEHGFPELIIYADDGTPEMLIEARSYDAAKKTPFKNDTVLSTTPHRPMPDGGRILQRRDFASARKSATTQAPLSS